MTLDKIGKFPKKIGKNLNNCRYISRYPRFWAQRKQIITGLVEGYANLDYAKELDGRKPITGHLFTMCGCIVS